MGNGQSVILDIVMPFYGDPDQFREAVESVRRQTSSSWRLIVVDDNYPDREPGMWVTELKDDRIIYVRNEINQGISVNYMKGVGLATSSHMVIMGCDDIMLPNYVDLILKDLEAHPEVDMIQCGVQCIDSTGRVRTGLADRVKSMLRPRTGQRQRMLGGQPLAVSLLRGNWTYFPSLCWKRSRIEQFGFRADLTIVQDLVMILNIIADGGTMLIDDTLAFLYRRHESSASSKTTIDGERFRQERVAFGELQLQFASHGWNKAARSARLHLTSRINALVTVPVALRKEGPEAAKTLLKHGVAR